MEVTGTAVTERDVTGEGTRSRASGFPRIVALSRGSFTC